MTKEIHTIHWNQVKDLSKLNQELVKDFDLYVFWPAPFNADACFKSAGFEDFEDSTDKGDKEFEMIIFNFLSSLDKAGDFKIRQKAFEKTYKVGLFRRKRIMQDTELYEQLDCSFNNDSSDNLIIDFGDKAVLVTGEGHALFCVLTKDSKLIENILKNIGYGRKTKKTLLKWEKILPREFSNKYQNSKNNKK